jgi:hypothetical protein
VTGAAEGALDDDEDLSGALVLDEPVPSAGLVGAGASDDALSLGTRVCILAGKHASRSGIVSRTPRGTFRDHVYVLLDPRPRERTKKNEMVARADLTRESGDPMLDRLAAWLAPLVADVPAYRNAHLNTPHTARWEADRAAWRAMQGLLGPDTDAYRRFTDDARFRGRFLDEVFARLQHGAPVR